MGVVSDSATSEKSSGTELTDTKGPSKVNGEAVLFKKGSTVQVHPRTW